MKKFLVTYLAPTAVIDEWKKTDPAKRKDAEGKMQTEWKQWMTERTKMFASNDLAAASCDSASTTE